MKQIITALLIIVLTVSLIAVTFTINQVKNEEQRLTVDLQHRSTLLAESFRETKRPQALSRVKKPVPMPRLDERKTRECRKHVVIGTIID